MYYYDLYGFDIDISISIVSDSLFDEFHEYRTPMYSFLPKYSVDTYRIRSPTKR